MAACFSRPDPIASVVVANVIRDAIAGRLPPPNPGDLLELRGPPLLGVRVVGDPLVPPNMAVLKDRKGNVVAIVNLAAAAEAPRG